MKRGLDEKRIADERLKELYEACKAGNVETVQRLISLGVDVNTTSKDSPLHCAAENGQIAVVEMLLKAGADVNKDIPLYVAAANGHKAVVEMFLKAGADVNKGKSTTPPLHIAAANGHYDVVAVLLSYNADGTMKDMMGRTALELIMQKYKKDIAPLFSKKSAEPVQKLDELLQTTLSADKLKICLLQKWASIADERAVTAETRATVAEERATRAEETASVAIKRAADSEERSITAEKRAVTAEDEKMVYERRAILYEKRAISAETNTALAEEKATTAEQRAIGAEGRALAFEKRANAAEMECAISKQKYFEAIKVTTAAEERATTAERRATVAEERASIADKNANTAEKRAVIAETRANIAETRASIAEQRIKVAEMETISAQKKAIDANTMVTTLEERARKAEDAAKVAQDSAHIFDTRIAELVQINIALEKRITRGDLQIRDLTAKCRHQQELLDKASAPSWVLKKDDVTFTDTEIGRGGWGVVKVARFCGLDVAAKLLHGAILSPHNQQLFMREMNIAAMVRHPNILLFIGATMDQECVILTELMQTSLRAVLEEKETNKLPLPRQQVSNIAMDVGKALNYLHLMKPDAIIHRDVSSSNVLLEQICASGADMWKAKLSDFGSSNFALQVTTVAPGNFTYAAPESFDTELQSPKMDVFSYGILLLEMSIGHFPEMQQRQELIQKLTWSAMKALVVECTTKDLKCRPSMADVLLKLKILKQHNQNEFQCITVFKYWRTALVMC